MEVIVTNTEKHVACKNCKVPILVHYHCPICMLGFCIMCIPQTSEHEPGWMECPGCKIRLEFPKGD